MWTNSICRSMHHARKCRLVSSGPLSQRIACGNPRFAMIPSSTRVTRRLAKLVSTSKAKHSRVYASTTLSTRIARPQATASCAKSSAHSWLAGVEGKLCLRKSQPQPALWELWTEGPRSCGKTVFGFFHSSGSFHNAFPRRRSVTLARSAQKKSPGSPPWGTGSAPFNFSLRSPIDGHRSKP